MVLLEQFRKLTAFCILVLIVHEHPPKIGHSAPPLDLDEQEQALQEDWLIDFALNRLIEQHQKNYSLEKGLALRVLQKITQMRTQQVMIV